MGMAHPLRTFGVEDCGPPLGGLQTVSIQAFKGLKAAHNSSISPKDATHVWHHFSQRGHIIIDAKIKFCRIRDGCQICSKISRVGGAVTPPADVRVFMFWCVLMICLLKGFRKIQKRYL